MGSLARLGACNTTRAINYDSAPHDDTRGRLHVHYYNEMLFFCLTLRPGRTNRPSPVWVMIVGLLTRRTMCLYP